MLEPSRVGMEWSVSVMSEGAEEVADAVRASLRSRREARRAWISVDSAREGTGPDFASIFGRLVSMHEMKG